MPNTRRHYRHQMPWNTCFALGVIFLVMLTLSVPRLQAREPDDTRPALRSLSKAFTQVAHDAMPAVVFIQVEKFLDAGQSPFGYNNPFDLFGEEFFERFFGRRFPEQRRKRHQPRQYRQQGQESGFIVSKDGYILTNHHVVGEADRITVTLAVIRDKKHRKLTAKIGELPDQAVARLDESEVLEKLGFAVCKT